MSKSLINLNQYCSNLWAKTWACGQKRGQISQALASLIDSFVGANFHNKWIDRGGPNLESLVVGEPPVTSNLEGTGSAPSKVA